MLHLQPNQRPARLGAQLEGRHVAAPKGLEARLAQSVVGLAGRSPLAKQDPLHIGQKGQELLVVALVKAAGVAGVFVLQLAPGMFGQGLQQLPGPAVVRLLTAAQQAQRPQQGLMQAFNLGHGHMMARSAPPHTAHCPGSTGRAAAAMLPPPAPATPASTTLSLEPRTLTVLLSLQLLSLGLVLPMLTGLRGSSTMRWAQGSLWTQLAGWAFVLARPNLPFVPALAISYGLAGLSFALGLRAVQGWLGPRPGMRLAWLLCPLGPLMLLLGHELPLLRYGAINIWLAALQGLLVLGACTPAPKAHESSLRWRTVLILPLLPLMALTLWRAYLGVTDPAAYPSLSGQRGVAQAYLVLSGLCAVFAALAYLTAWRGEAEGRLRHQAKTDSLTQLANRRAFQQRGAEMLAVARRHHEPLALYLLDVDHFKQINDVHGHVSGDEALGAAGTPAQAGGAPGRLRGAPRAAKSSPCCWRALRARVSRRWMRAYATP